MTTAAVAFGLAFVVSLVLTPAVRAFAVRWGVLDQARSSRKIHERPIPRLGGIAIVVAFFAPLVGLYFVESGVGNMFFQHPRSAIGIFAGGLAIALLGVYDDLVGSGAGKKFAVQFAVAGLLYYLGFRIDRLANPFGPDLELGMLAIPVTLLWIVGVVNAMNLIDGLDGLAGGVAIFAIGTTFVISFNHSNPLMMLFTAALGGAILGFLFFNFNPATIFMGDTGSMFLGFVLAASAIQTNQKSTTAVAVLTPLLALGLPLLDTALAITRRAVRGRPLFSADKEHIHHRLMSRGLSHRQAALTLYAFCIVLNSIAIGLVYANRAQTAIALGALAAGMFLFMRRLGYIQYSSVHYLSDQRRKNRMLRSGVRVLTERLKECTTEDEIWEVLKGLGPMLGASIIAINTRASRHSDEWRAKRFQIEAVEGDHTAFIATHHVDCGLYAEAILELVWHDGRAEMDRDEEIAIESLVEALGAAYDRLAPSRSPFTAATRYLNGKLRSGTTSRLTEVKRSDRVKPFRKPRDRRVRPAKRS
jgi:UDP-GlcNAc:undecaprenyl-phosphate GlcNAc-1-phosphate transferase